MTDISKIPSYILEDARKNVPMNSDSESYTDEELSKMSKRQILDHYLNWHGLIGYAANMIAVIEGIYNIKLED